MKGEYYFLSDELLYSVSFLFAKDVALFLPFTTSAGSNHVPLQKNISIIFPFLIGTRPVRNLKLRLFISWQL